jgi:peptide/nickel transport system substrate-binding protein
MYYAIDRRTINDELFGGRNRILWNPPGFDENIEGLNKYEYDPEKAKALLQEAAAAGAVDLSKPIRFYYATDLNDGGKVAPIVKSQLEGLGVGLKVELTGVTTDQWLATVSDDSQRGNYDVTFDAGGNEGLGPWNTVRYVLCGPDQPPGGYDGYENCDLVDLFNKALTQVDETERAATYAEIAKVLNDEQPQLYLWSLSGVHVVNKRLQGVTVPAFERYAFEEVNTWSVTQ